MEALFFCFIILLDTQVSLAPTPVSSVADMVADIEVHMVADMKVDSNINIINFFHKHHNIINDYHRLSLKCTPIQSQFANRLSWGINYKWLDRLDMGRQVRCDVMVIWR